MKLALIPNHKVLVRYLSYSDSDANIFQKKIIEAENTGYKILSCIVDNKGIFKLTAKLKPAKLTKCVLKEKEINEDEDFHPNYKYRHSYNGPRYCPYNIDGICICINHNSCLYQKTIKHETVLRKMVDIYKKKSKETNDYEQSYFYDDTEYGRIFSKEYDHLNEFTKIYPREI